MCTYIGNLNFPISKLPQFHSGNFQSDADALYTTLYRIQSAPKAGKSYETLYRYKIPLSLQKIQKLLMQIDSKWSKTPRNKRW